MTSSDVDMIFKNLNKNPVSTLLKTPHIKFEVIPL